jgi:hypothetical protein
MGRLIEEQAVIDCLTNTAKYYEREDADEWTKGIHYGLLHGLDNILDDVSPVEAIPKADYESRLKADVVAMLTEIQLDIEELRLDRPLMSRGYECYRFEDKTPTEIKQECSDIIQQKIDDLNNEK